MKMQVLLRIAGALLITLAAAHVFFPRRFHWRQELARLSLLNRQMFVVHTCFICLILVMMGALSLFAPHTLLDPTPLSRLVLAGLTCFWGLRLGVQWFVYDWKLWRGNIFNTFVQFLFSAVWAYLTIVYASALITQL